MKKQAKKLLCFAYRGEAQFFLNGVTTDSSVLDGFFEHPDYFVLITGEDLAIVIQKLTTALNLFSINQVINMGIAGSLHSKLEKDQIYEIRTVYGEEKFKSFTVSQGSSTIDGISSKERVLDPKYAKTLSYFAQCVDREAWAVASTCHFFKMPLKIYKLISDEPLEASLCETIQSHAEKYAQKLYSYYVNLNFNLEAVAKEKTLFNNPLLYFTFSMKQQYESLISKLLLKFSSEEKILELAGWDSIQSAKVKPKERTQLLLAELDNLLNPYRKKIKNELVKATEKHQQQGVNIQWASDFENDHLQIHFKVTNQDDLNRKLIICSQIDIVQIQKSLNGDWDV